jgi:integrase
VLASDGVGTLSFDEARQRALELSQSERVAGSVTVGRAFETYVRDLQARSKSTEVARTASIYLAEIADVPVAELTTAMLQSWLATVAAVSVRHRKQPDGDEAARKRRNSANRIAACLVAALNHAFRAGRVSSDAAWKRLRKFEGVDAARTRFLSIAESVRLLNACDPDLRNLVRAALETGCRFGELARLVVTDFNSDVGALAIRKSKTNRARHVVLTDEGVAFFRALTAGRSGGDLMLTRARRRAVAAHECGPDDGRRGRARENHAANYVSRHAPFLRVALDYGRRPVDGRRSESRTRRHENGRAPLRSPERRLHHRRDSTRRAAVRNRADERRAASSA